jgi:phenylacetate-CoA ligase
VWTHLDRQASPLLRYRSSDLATVWTDPCPCGRTTPRIRIGGRRDDMLRVQAVNVYPQAIGELLGGARHAIVADGDPIVPPLHVYVEGDADPQKLKAALRTDIAVHPLAPGTLPVAEHKTAKVFRTARGDQLPEAIRRAHERQH